MKQDFNFSVEEKVAIFNKKVAVFRDWYDETLYKINGKWYIPCYYYIEKITEEQLQDDENDILVKGYVEMRCEDDGERIQVDAKFRFVWERNYWDLLEWYEENVKIEDFEF